MVDQNLALDEDASRELYQFNRTLENYISNNKDGEFAVYVIDCIQPLENATEMRRSLMEGTGAWEDIYRKAKSFASESNHSTEDFLKNMRFDGFTNKYTYPDKFDAAIFADEIKYVGQTGDLARRVREHLAGQGTYFTKVFPPYRLSKVEWVDTREKAEQRESELHERVNNVTDSMFLYASHKVNYIYNAQGISEITEVDGIGPVDMWRVRDAQAKLDDNQSGKKVREEIESEIFGKPVELIGKNIDKDRKITYAGGGK